MPEETGNVATIATEGGSANHSEGAPAGGNDQGSSANNQGRGWLAGLPADLREKSEFQSMRTVGELGKAYLDAQAKLAQAIIPPGDGARDDEVKAFRTKLGVPESPQGYEIDSSGDSEFAERFRKVAHEQGLTAPQAQSLYADIMSASRSFAEKAKSEAAAARQKGIEALKAEWGDRFDLNDAAARRLAMVTGGDFASALADSGAIDDPRVLKGLYRFSNMLSEDRLVEGRGQRQTDTGWQFPNTPGM